jgi:formylglycine-generating enzyme required for sulfatase activity
MGMDISSPRHAIWAVLVLLASCNGRAKDALEAPIPEQPTTPLTTDWPLSREAAVALQVREAHRLNVPPACRLDLGEDVGIDLVLIPQGVFPMGNPSSASQNNPPHLVQISRSFLMARYEATWQQFLKVVDLADLDLGTRSTVENYVIPERRMEWVADVHWVHARSFCRSLSAAKGIKARLPTEAEWEYACRAGTTARYGEWDSIDDTKANVSYWLGPDGTEVYSKRDSPAVQSAGQYDPNRWGLYDMIGNVSEWCLDRYSSRLDLSSLPSIDPFPNENGSVFRVVRGSNCSTVFERMGDASTADSRAIRLVVEIDDATGKKVVEANRKGAGHR